MANAKAKASRQAKSKANQPAPRKRSQPVERVSTPTIKLDEEQLDSLANKIADIMFQREEQAVSIPPEPKSAFDLATELFGNPVAWLKAPNPELGDRRPIDMLGTDEEFRVYNLLNAMDWGLH